MSIQSLLKSFFIDVIKSYFKSVAIGLVVVIFGAIQCWLVFEYKKIKVELSKKELENLFNATVSLDRIGLRITEEMNNCEVDGIYSGLFVVHNGVGKFIYLRGRWDFNIDKKQQHILEFPELIKGIQSQEDIQHILNVCNNIVLTMKTGSTKDTNPIYTVEYYKGNNYGEIDLNTYDFFANASHYNKIIDFGQHKEAQSLAFIMYLINNLNLSKHFSSNLSALYLYPLKVQGLDFAFLTLSFVNAQESKCFSKDLALQTELFIKMRKIIDSEIEL